MKQTDSTVVRDDGVRGSNPGTPRPVRTSIRTTTSIPLVTVARFWSKVTVPEQGDKCWLWHGAVSKNGYGSFRLERKATSAHRFAYRLANGEWPAAGLLIRHKCDNPRCVCPSHLELGSHVDNARDMVERGRDRRGPTIGESNGNAKLNGEAVARIRELFKMGQTNTAIAKRYGVTHSMISRIRRGRSWVS